MATLQHPSVESYAGTKAGLDILGKREIYNLYLESNNGVSSPSSELYTAVCCVDEHYVPSAVVALCTARCTIQSALKYILYLNLRTSSDYSFPTQMDCVCCAVQTAYLNVIQVNVSL